MQSLEHIPMESESAQSEQTSEPIDLSAIAAAHPVNQRTMVLDLATFDASQLTLLEVMDMAEIAGVPPAELGALLKVKKVDSQKTRMLYALAWVIARRADDALRYSDVIRWKLEIRGTTTAAPDPIKASRAKVRVGAAKLTGLPPEDAERLTIAEISEYHDKRPQRRAPVRRGRKR